MSSLADVFRVLHRLRENGMITDYAIGRATAVLFYAEPTRTYDLDVFVTLPSAGSESEPLRVVHTRTRSCAISDAEALVTAAAWH